MSNNDSFQWTLKDTDDPTFIALIGERCNLLFNPESRYFLPVFNVFDAEKGEKTICRTTPAIATVLKDYDSGRLVLLGRGVFYDLVIADEERLRHAVLVIESSLGYEEL